MIFLDPPKIVEFTESSDVPALIASSNATITCNATGFPVPDVTILKDGSPLDMNDQFLNVSSTFGSLYRSVTVVLTELDFFDSAEYSCNATNQLASFQRVMSPVSLYTVQCELADTFYCSLDLLAFFIIFCIVQWSDLLLLSLMFFRSS